MTIIIIIGLVLFAISTACIPEFPARKTEDAGSTDGGSKDLGPSGKCEEDKDCPPPAICKGGTCGTGCDGPEDCTWPASVCQPDHHCAFLPCGNRLDCPAPAVCREDRCRLECQEETDCEWPGSTCSPQRGQCSYKPCHAPDGCPDRHVCQPQWGCLPYCEEDGDCPQPTRCLVLNEWVKICGCTQDGHCPAGRTCVEGQCIERCAEEPDQPCSGDVGRYCDTDYGRCLPRPCSGSLVDPVCGSELAESCFLYTQDAHGVQIGFCTRTCEGTAGGDGDTCGPGFRCDSFYTEQTYCIPVGNTPVGEECQGNGFDIFCTSSFCFDDICTVLCTGATDHGFCQDLLGEDFRCLRTGEWIGSNRVWACRRRPGN